MNNIKIKTFLIFCIIFLLSSCKRNTNIYTLIPPCKYRIEYSGNKINIIKTDHTGKISSMIWTKRNGEYFDQANHLKMSLKDTLYYLSRQNNIEHKKQFIKIQEEKDSLYSSSTSYVWKDQISELVFVVYYDKSYRIKKIRSKERCEFVNK